MNRLDVFGAHRLFAGLICLAKQESHRAILVGF